MIPNVWDLIQEILDADFDQRNNTVDLTGDFHSMLESLHTRLLSLENKI